MKINQQLTSIIKLISLTIIVIFIASCSTKVPGISEAKLEEIELKYGEQARQRVEDWRFLIADNQT